jgi:phosphatidylinositol-bisphosphatase
MAKNKKEEQMITDTFEDLMKKNNPANVRYEYFDFHHAVKGQRFDRVNGIIYKLQPMIENFRFYVEDTVKRTIQLTQKGAVRTNCLDCLDRTNFFQGKVAMLVFEAMMRQFGVDLTSAFGQDLVSQLDNDNLKQVHPFVANFKNIWADNGDAISIHYAGTGSVISNVTRTGKRNFFGLLDHGMKTINRFYIGNFEDQIKQECIDVLVGQHTDTVNVFGEALEKAVKEREKEFSTFEDVNLLIASWNVGGFQPTASLDLTNLFNIEGNNTPDVVVVGLQEYVVSSATSMFYGTSKEGIAVWRECILNNLKYHDKYVAVKEQCLQGILLLIFAKENMRERITKVETDSVKTGLGGNLGNKGATVIKLFIDDSSFVFMNVHIEPGNSANNTRLLNLIDIHQRAFKGANVGKSTDVKMNHIDYKFLFGDTNFRVDYPNKEVRALIENYNTLAARNRTGEANNVLGTLLQYDQLLQSKNSSDVLEKYQEGAITFLPTYKYDAFSNTYDTSSKQRVPSWTDRILWSCNFGIVKQLFYSRREYKESDHRPVVSYFSVETKRVNQNKKEETMKEVYETDKNLQKTIIQEEEALKREVEEKALAPEGRLQNMGYLTRDIDAKLDANGEPIVGSGEGMFKDLPGTDPFK